MSKSRRLGHVVGLEIRATNSTWIAMVLLWILFAAVGIWVLQLGWLAAVVAGLLATLIHYGSDLLHHIGHAIAARSTGYPMAGVRFWGLLGMSVYPRDEPPLPARVHIRRALGGPIMSIAIGLVATVAALALRDSGGVGWWLLIFLAVDNLVVLGLGAFLPLGFTDGSTILNWWGR